jgi:Flp pilus assembly protein TadB
MRRSWFGPVACCVTVAGLLAAAAARGEYAGVAVVVGMIAAAGLPAWYWWRRPYRDARRAEKGLCVRCGYDLTGNVSGVCPECGKEAKWWVR